MLDVTLLTPLRGKAHLSPVISFDVETFGQSNIFQFGVVSTTEGDYLFTEADKLLDFMTQKKYWNHIGYATNLQFDGPACFQAVSGPGRTPPGWSYFFNGTKLIWLKKLVATEKRKGTGEPKHKFMTVTDSLNVFPAGVEEMGKILLQVSKNHRNEGNTALADYYFEEKLKAPKWLGKRMWKDLSTGEQATFGSYCAADARVSRKFMEWFSGEVISLGGEMRITAASTTLDIFRRKYMAEDNLVIPQPMWESLMDSRLSYYGGRTEDFIKGSHMQVWDNDVTAMYPSAMVEIEFPYPSPERFIKIRYPPDSILEHEGFSCVTIDVPYMHIPPLPFRQGPKLLFPYGQLRGTWTHIELRYAIALGCKIEEIEWSYFNPKTFNPFRNFVYDLFKKRMEYAYPISCADRNCEYHTLGKQNAKCKSAYATEEVVKLFLNGLYGKFAQNFLTEEQADSIGVMAKKAGGTFKTLEEATMEEIQWTGENHPEWLAKGYVLNKVVPKLRPFMNPILSSYVTARARVNLHQFIMEAKRENSETLYVDTDSLYTTKKLSFAIQAKELGKLQEGKEYKRITIFGPKAKQLEKQDGTTIETWKGLPGKSFLTNWEQETSPQDWSIYEPQVIHPRKEAFDNMKSGGSKVKTRFSRFMKFKEAHTQNLTPNFIKEMEKTFDPFAFPKRRIIGNPTLDEFFSKRFNSEPWEIEAKSQLILGAENAS